MPSAIAGDNLPLAGGQTTAPPAQTPSVPTQNGASEPVPAPAIPQTGGGVDAGIPAMPLPAANAQLAPYDGDGAVTPKAVTPAAIIADPLGAAPEGASQTSGTDIQINGNADCPTNGTANGRRDSDAPLFARRRTGIGVSTLDLSIFLSFFLSHHHHVAASFPF
jgi:hypothetical protein